MINEPGSRPSDRRCGWLRSRQRAVVAFPVTLLLLASLSHSPALAAAPEAKLWAHWSPHADSQSISVDHSPWQALLQKHVVRLEDGRTAVHYDQFDQQERTALSAYIESLAAIDPASLTRAQQMAYWINLYNALTVRLILDNPGKKSILRIGGGWLPSGPWDDEVVAIDGKRLTLNDIEHRILRPIWQDHRVHFAVNCASVGCPNLRRDAFTARNLEAGLSAAETDFLNHPRALKFNDRGKLQLSNIFDWYMDDFASDRQAMLDYLATQRPDLAAQVRSYTGDIDYEYDWSLNAAP